MSHPMLRFVLIVLGRGALQGRRAVWLVLLALGIGSHAAAVPVPGSSEHLPTPDSPTGFRADGNGWYPAATPPLQWWDGQPTMVTNPAAGKVWRAPKRIPGYANREPKNILWKVRLPSWGEAQPLVVGKRVIVLGDPDLVICYDAETGKECWRDRVELLNLPTLGGDRRGLDPAPADADKRQTIWELARAASYLQRNIRSSNPQEAIALARKAAATWNEWKAVIAANDTGFMPVADQIQAALNTLMDPANASAAATEFAGGKRDPFAAAQGDWSRLIKAYAAPIPAVTKGLGLSADLPNNCGAVMATPASDGKVVVSVFGYGQVVCHDVTTGKRLWAWRDTVGLEAAAGDRIPSPRIWKNLVFVRSYGGTEMLGIRLADGQVVWETDLNGSKAPGQGNKVFGNYASPLLVHLTDTKGGRQPVLLTNLGLALRPTDGAIISSALFPAFNDKSASMNLLPGGRLLVVESGCGTCGAVSKTILYQLRLDASGAVVSTPVPPTRDYTHGERIPFLSVKPGQPGYLTPDQQMDQHWPNYFHGESLAVGDRFICGDRNITTLEGLHRWGRGPTEGYFVGPEMAPVIAGAYLISGLSGDKQGLRGQAAIVAPMRVWDVNGPLPFVVSEHNLVGDVDLPSDPIWERYLKPAGYELARNIGHDHGIFGFFGNRLGGVVPQGEKLYFQSMTHLYCVGPAVKGTPRDDPRVVDTIRRETSVDGLATYLSNPSAAYRYEGFLRLRDLGGVTAAMTNQFARLIAQDPYEEIRAMAVEAMEAVQPGSGLAVWFSDLMSFLAMSGNAFELEERGYSLEKSRHAATLRVLGEKADKVFTARIATATPVMRQNLLAIAAQAGVCGPQLKEACLAVMRDGKRGREGADQSVFDAIDVLMHAGAVKANAEAVTSALRVQTTGWMRHEMHRNNPGLERVLGTVDVLMDEGVVTPELVDILGNLLASSAEDAKRFFPVIARIQRMGKPAGNLAPKLETLKTGDPRLGAAVDYALARIR